jgi:uncharacterized protein YidB (DUF937 family)
MGSNHPNGVDACAALAGVVNGFIQKQGGVTGVIGLFEKQGLGAVAKSWVGNGNRQPITDAQIFRALGYVTLQQLGAQLCLSPDETAAKLSEALPKAIANATAPASYTPSSPRPIWSFFLVPTK